MAWDAADEPAWGTASIAGFWVALEQPGPWGRTAFDSSRLDPRVGSALERESAAAGGRALLVRAVSGRDAAADRGGRPAGRDGTPRSPGPDERTVFVAGGMPQGRPWLLAGTVTDPARVIDLPWAAIAAGDAPAVLAAAPWLTPRAEPVLLVCAHSKRDVCCAVRGRPVARDAAAARPGQVWECSHTGGHRFAPTAVLLPHGTTLGRLDAGVAVEAVDAAAGDRLPADLDVRSGLRGLSYLGLVEQVADAAVREHAGVDDLLALRVRTRPADPSGPTRRVEVTHADGRRWAVEVSHRVGGPARPGSCGAAPVPSTCFDADVTAL